MGKGSGTKKQKNQILGEDKGQTLIEMLKLAPSKQIFQEFQIFKTFVSPNPSESGCNRVSKNR